MGWLGLRGPHDSPGMHCGHAVQIMAAVRCKRSKWTFLARTFLGKDWQENELFYPSQEVQSSQDSLGAREDAVE